MTTTTNTEERTPCTCKLCIRSREWKSIMDRGDVAELKTLLETVIDSLYHAEFESSIHDANADASWPSAREYAMSILQKWDARLDGIEEGIEYAIAKVILEPVSARRSGLSHFQHVREGVRILVRLGASKLTQRAFALHPLVQKTEDFLRNLTMLQSCDPKAVALAVEYRSVANRGVRSLVRDNGWKVELSDIPEINLMLTADKVQNRKDFLGSLSAETNVEEYEELCRYFSCWLEALGVSEDQYLMLVAAEPQ